MNAPNIENRPDWFCNRCGHRNEYQWNACQMCHVPNPSLTPLQTSQPIPKRKRSWAIPVIILSGIVFALLAYGTAVQRVRQNGGDADFTNPQTITARPSASINAKEETAKFQRELYATTMQNKFAEHGYRDVGALVIGTQLHITHSLPPATVAEILISEPAAKKSLRNMGFTEIVIKQPGITAPKFSYSLR